MIPRLAGLMALMASLQLTAFGAATKPQPALPIQRRAGFIPLGVYWPGEASFRGVAPGQRWRRIDATLAGMESHHINAIWIVNENTRWVADLARHAGRHGIFLVAATTDSEGKLDWVRRGDHAALIARTMHDWGDAPRPIAWGLSDEPPMAILPEMQVYASDWKKYAPGEPTTTVEPRGLIDAASKLPFTMFTSDVYPFFSPGNPLGYGMGGDWVPWLTYTRQVVQAALRPWMMGQSCQEPMGPYTFDAQGNLVYLPGGTVHYVMPTPAEIKWQAWSAFALGAKGMFFFHYALPAVPNPQARIPEAFSKLSFPAMVHTQTNSKSPLGLTYENGEGTPQYEALGEAFQKLSRLVPILAPLKPSAWHAAWLSSHPDGGAVVSLLGHPQTGKHYLMVVAPFTGTGHQEVRVQITPQITGLHDILTGRAIPIKKSASARTITLTLPPGEGVLLVCSGG